MLAEDKKRTVEIFDALVLEHKYDQRSLCLPSPERQEVSFQSLLSIGDVKNKSVLDLGCGVGHLFDFLTKKNIPVEYTGFDISPNMIALAQKMHPGVRFEVRDVLDEGFRETFDYVVMSGIFNIRVNDNTLFARRLLTKSFELCKVGVGANFITKYVDFEDDFLYYASPEEVFAFCKGLTKWVTLKHDYYPWEFTLFMYADRKA